MSNFLEFLQGEEGKTNKKKAFTTENVSVICPKSFADIQQLLDSLKLKEGFIVDFESVDASLSQRMLDFLSGAIYSLDGKIEQLKNKMYIILPKGLNIKTKLTKGQK